MSPSAFVYSEMAPPTEQHKTRGGARRARQEVGAGPSADRVDSSTQKSRVAKNRRGDPEKRQALSVHALLKKVTGSSAREAKTEVPSLQTDDRAQCAASTSCFGDSAPAELAPDSPGEGLERVSSSAAPRECLAGQVGLFMFDFEECDSKRCTGRRLLHHGKLNLIRADGSVSYSQGARRHLAETESSSEASSEDSSPYEEAEALRGAEEESLRREGGDSLSEGPPDMASSGANSEEEGRHESAPKGRLQRHLPFRSRKFQGILLSPYGDERTPLLSPADASLIAARGLAVVDCSWKKVQEGKKARRIDFVKGRSGPSSAVADETPLPRGRQRQPPKSQGWVSGFTSALRCGVSQQTRVTCRFCSAQTPPTTERQTF